MRYTIVCFVALVLVCYAVAQTPYYDDKRDQHDKTEYYDKLVGGLNSPTNKLDLKSLTQLLTSTHKRQVGYTEARANLYKIVDRKQEGDLKCVYSDKEVEGSRDLRFMIRGNEFDVASGYNCEHSVPQSWFEKRLPMKGDMHHLFTAESNCNGFRSSYPFGQFNKSRGDAVLHTLEGCGTVFSLDGVDSFEPHHGKGAVARAFLYFISRYPGAINQHDVPAHNLADMLRWAQEDKVSLWEQHRNANIYQLQGNRNPFIDFADFASKLDFSSAISKQ
jgi:deoxyribonuclease-1